MNEIHMPYVLLLGAAGGFLNHLYLHENTLLLPRVTGDKGERGLALGFLSDIVLGVGGALVGMYLVVGTDAPVIKQAAVCLLGGFGGGSLLARNTIELEKQRQQLRSYAQTKSDAGQGRAAQSGREASDALASRIERASSVLELRKIRRDIDHLASAPH